MSAKSSSSSLLIKVAVVVVVLVALAILIPRLLRPVVVVQDVVSGEAIDAKPGNVSVTAEYGMDIKSEAPGRVMPDDYNVAPGKVVKVGEILVKIDSGDLAIDIAQTETDLKAAKRTAEIGTSANIDLEGVESDYSQGEKQFKYGAISQLDLDKLKRAVDAAKQKVDLEKVLNDQKIETYENTLALKKRQMEKMTIRSQIDGIVSAVFAHPGDLINPNASVATLITTHKVVVGTIAEEDFANVKIGQKVAVIFDTYGSWVYNGTVSKILPTADSTTQRQQIYIDISDIEPEKLIPGITGELTVTVGQRQSKTIVPRKAVLGDYVFVVNDGVVARRPIKRGYSWTTGVEVLEGLSPGDQVVTRDFDKIHEGEHAAVQVEPSDVFKKTN